MLCCIKFPSLPHMTTHRGVPIHIICVEFLHLVVSFRGHITSTIHCSIRIHKQMLVIHTYIAALGCYTNILIQGAEPTDTKKKKKIVDKHLYNYYTDIWIFICEWFIEGVGNKNRSNSNAFVSPTVLKWFTLLDFTATVFATAASASSSHSSLCVMHNKKYFYCFYRKQQMIMTVSEKDIDHRTISYNRFLLNVDHNTNAHKNCWC